MSLTCGHGVAHICAQVDGQDAADGVATVTEVEGVGLTTCTPVTLASQQSLGHMVRQNLRQIGEHCLFGFAVAGFGGTTGAAVPGLLTQGYPGYPGYPPHKLVAGGPIVM